MSMESVKRSVASCPKHYLWVYPVLAFGFGFAISAVLGGGATFSHMYCNLSRSTCVEWWTPTNVDVILNWSDLAFPHQHSCYYSVLVRDSEGRKLGTLEPDDWCTSEGLRSEDVSIDSDRIRFGRFGYFDLSNQEWIW